jgi:hypothetical protein
MEGRKAVSQLAEPMSNFRVGARGHVSLLDPETEYGYKGTYLGKKKVLTLGAAVQYEPHVVYEDLAQFYGAKNYTGWTADYFFEYPLEGMGTATISGAYEQVDFDDAYLALNPDPNVTGIDGQKNGWYAKAGYMLPKLPLQLFGRYETWRFARLQNVYDQRVDWLAGGANYYLHGQDLKLTLEVSNTGFDKTGTFSGVTTREFNTITGQLQIVF